MVNDIDIFAQELKRFIIEPTNALYDFNIVPPGAVYWGIPGDTKKTTSFRETLKAALSSGAIIIEFNALLTHYPSDAKWKVALVILVRRVGGDLDLIKTGAVSDSVEQLKMFYDMSHLVRRDFDNYIEAQNESTQTHS